MVDEFLDGLEKQFAYYSGHYPTDADKITFAVLFLTFKANAWWKASAGARAVDPVDTWDAFKEAIRVRYQPIGSAMIARQSLDTFVQKGTVQNYTDHFYRCMVYVKDMGMSDQVHQYTRGLKREIKQKVIESKVTTLHEAVIEAHSAESYLGLAHAGVANSFSGSRYTQRSSYGPSSHSSSAPMDVNFLGAIDGESTDEAAHVEDSGADTLRRMKQQIAALESQVRMQSSIANMFSGQNSSSSASGGRAPKDGSSAQRVSNVSPEDFARCRAENRCLKCHGVGHIARECKGSRSLKW